MSTNDNNDQLFLHLWKAFCKSRQALGVEFDSTGVVINKWNDRYNRFENLDQIKKYIAEYITKEGHVLDDPF